MKFSLIHLKRNTILALILLCLFGTSCVKKLNLYEENNEDGQGNNNSQDNKGKDVISEPDFFYPFNKEGENNNDGTNNRTIELTIHTQNKLPEIASLKAEIPTLKYNKSWLFMLTQDDCKQAAFCYTWATINGKPIPTTKLYYDIAQLQAGDLPTEIYEIGKTLGCTDGAGKEVRFSFTTTLESEKEYMNVTTNVNKGFTGNLYRFFLKSGLVWGNVKEMLNYGVGIAFHDLNTLDVYNINTLVTHYGMAQDSILKKLEGRGCKMLAVPNGNKSYTDAAKQYLPVKTITGETYAEKLYPFQENPTPDKRVIERVFKDDPNSFKDVIISELQKPEKERRAICVGVHSTADISWMNFLLWLNDQYGKDGQDNVWMPNQEEYYEYNYYRANGQIDALEQIDDYTVKLTIHLPMKQYFYYPSITVNLSGLQFSNLSDVTTNESVTGLSYASHNNGIMINIDCRKYLPEHAENFVKRYEKDRTNASNKADALYFVNMLKSSNDKIDLLNRIK